MYFRFPSTVFPDFSSLNSVILEEEFNSTLMNYEKGYLETNFNQQEKLKTCTPFFGQAVPVLGIICYTASTELLMKEITNSISSPEFKQIKSEYFMMLPIYPSSEDQRSPSIVANFTIQNLSNIQYSFTENRLFPMENVPTLSYQLFTGLKDYILHVTNSPSTIYQESSSTSFYITPITTDFTFFRKKSIGLYLLIMNTEVELDITTSNYFYDITVALITPSMVMISLALISTVCILKKRLK